MRCPLCYKEPIKTEHGLRKHLTGSRKYGGHELSERAADEQVAVALREQSVEASNQGNQVVRGRPVEASALSVSDSSAVRPNNPAAMPYAETVLRPAGSSPFLETVLSTLVEFKVLPKYQFERRIDGFLSIFLPEILAHRFGGNVELVAPEFPIKKRDSNQSTNVDYVFFRRGADRAGDRWLFFELKTDLGSVRDEQLDDYEHARQRGMRTLLMDVEAIRSASKERTKYDALIRRLAEYPASPIEIVILAPAKVERAAVHSLTFADLLDIELDGYAAEWTIFRDLVIRRAFV